MVYRPCHGTTGGSTADGYATSKSQRWHPPLVVVLIEVLVLSRSALLLNGIGGAGSLFVLNVKADGGVAPHPPPRALLLLNGNNRENYWGILALT